MTRNTREKKTQHSIHQYERQERTIPGLNYYYFQCKICNNVEFPMPELQKIWDYSKTNQFMFIQDWILALLFSRPDLPMIGITSFMKQLFLTLLEFAQENDIPTENPGFRGYKFGPYSDRIEDVIMALEEADLLKTIGRRGTKGEYFVLTEKGVKNAKKSYEKLTPIQQKKLAKQRLNWHQFGTECRKVIL